MAPELASVSWKSGEQHNKVCDVSDPFVCTIRERILHHSSVFHLDMLHPVDGIPGLARLHHEVTNVQTQGVHVARVPKQFAFLLTDGRNAPDELTTVAKQPL